MGFIKNFGKANSIVLFICIILLLLEFAGDRHGETDLEELLFFPAIFGFVSCIIIFKVGVALRSIFMRDEDYYDK
ncbi:MAG: hypothetical protein CMN50_04895 [SAR116 cluster bacterium]|nr:hypothetical protein [SAR116 cluster bacterium]|tara:strand:+ start:211 stop:435 length:225 start_codon:yes stop_codon:yes gene_type:complete